MSTVRAVSLMCAVSAIWMSTGLFWPATCVILAYMLGFLAVSDKSARFSASPKTAV